MSAFASEVKEPERRRAPRHVSVDRALRAACDELIDKATASIEMARRIAEAEESDWGSVEFVRRSSFWLSRILEGHAD